MYCLNNATQADFQIRRPIENSDWLEVLKSAIERINLKIDISYLSISAVRLKYQIFGMVIPQFIAMLGSTVLGSSDDNRSVYELGD